MADTQLPSDINLPSEQQNEQITPNLDEIETTDQKQWHSQLENYNEVNQDAKQGTNFDIHFCINCK